MRNTILTALMAAFSPTAASAQFHTVTKNHAAEAVSTLETAENPDNKEERYKTEATCRTSGREIKDGRSDNRQESDKRDDGRKGDVSTWRKDTATRNARAPKTRTPEARAQTAAALPSQSKPLGQGPPSRNHLPELTLHNLYAELERHGIRHPKIVLAQAILETGWFRSHACRKKNNLFGLTNPRTGKYFEFAHWTESVRAYYTKVQYRYTGGNYLLWLKKIGYAEDPGYIRAVIRVLRML